MKNKIRFQDAAFGLFLSLALLLLAGCASSGSAKGNEVNVTLSSYKIDMDKSSVPAGSVTFHIKNTASDMEHEFIVFQTDLDPSKLPLDNEGNVAEDQLKSLGEKELKPNESGDLTIDMPAGHYVMVCNQPGHYQQGMYTAFTVQ